jgi:hypothetical protein
MKKLKRNALVVLTCSLLVVVYGCSNGGNPIITPTTTTVSGHVLDTYGNPLSSPATVYIGGQTTTTAGDGSFTINNVTKPYDVYVMSSTGVFGVKGLTINNPYLPGAINVSPTMAISVTIPMVPSGSKATIMFQDTVTGKISGYGEILAGQTIGSISMGGTNGQQVAGNVYVLEYILSGGVVSSYSGYAEQPLTFTFGGAASVTFNSLLGGLGSLTVSGTVNGSGGANLKAQLYINFGSRNNIVHRGGLIQNIDISGNTGTFNFIVPTLTSPTPLLNVLAVTVGPPIAQRMKTLIAPSSGTVISIDSIPSLITPANNASNVDTTTLFSYTNGGGNGIHFIRLTPTSSGCLFQIITKGTSFTVPNLSAYGSYTLGSMALYSWADNGKIMDINSTDDFCTQFFDVNPSILGITQSTTFNFTSR